MIGIKINPDFEKRRFSIFFVNLGNTRDLGFL